VEVRDGQRLVGGIYGVMAGGVFAGESMFSTETGGSKVALAALCRALSDWGVAMLDAQVENPHLTLLGARPLPRDDYLRWLARPVPQLAAPGSWMNRFPVSRAAQLA
jgi:leucyl/phenylalanyl-tRNA--protein transferase